MAEVVVADRYELGAIVGQGATATVYRAQDRRLNRVVAVKVFHSETMPLGERRYHREMRVLSRLDHPGLVTLRDAGTHQERAFLVTDLVQGRTLDEHLDRQRFSIRRATKVGAELADTLSYVHQHGILHRDLKPGNVIIGSHGPVISDFGIAQLLDATRCTRTGVVIGTPAYMAPEQVRGARVGPAADIFALGLVLLECLTGHREYPGTAVESAVARLHRLPTIPDTLPSSLGSLLEQMTDADSAMRPLASQVAEILREEEWPARTVRRATARLWLDRTGSAHSGTRTVPHDQNEQTTTALDDRLVVAHAIGLVAGVLAVDIDEAQALLERASLRDQRPLPEVAHDLVDGRTAAIEVNALRRARTHLVTPS